MTKVNTFFRRAGTINFPVIRGQENIKAWGNLGGGFGFFRRGMAARFVWMNSVAFAQPEVLTAEARSTRRLHGEILGTSTPRVHV